MRGHHDEIDRALVTLCDAVANRLSAEGWYRRVLDDDRTDVTLTRPAQNGVMAVARIDRTSFHWPDEWPVEIGAAVGVGFEPALDLMPLLTLGPRAMLIDESEDGHADSFTVSLEGLDGVARAARQIVQFVIEHASTATRDFPDAAAIDARLQREIESVLTSSGEQNDDEVNEPGASDFDTQLRLVVLAAMGRHDDARALLATYPAGQTDAPIDRHDRRFIRQLTRWLDAGGPVAPAVEDTLAQLPRRARPPRTSWADARAKSKSKREALDAARAKSKGKSLDQLKVLIAAEHGNRGIDIAPSVVDLDAEMLQIGQRPFGRTRTALKAIRMLKSGGGDAIRLIKHASDQAPEWLQPPDRAAYPMIADRDRYTSVDLDAGAQEWLERVRSEAPRRIGTWVLIDVWLTREDPAGPLVAHIGEQRVGTVGNAETSEFNQALRAAALFDEDPFVKGRLTRAAGTGQAVLEIPMPARPDTDAAT